VTPELRRISVVDPASQGGEDLLRALCRFHGVAVEPVPLVVEAVDEAGQGLEADTAFRAACAAIVQSKGRSHVRDASIASAILRLWKARRFFSPLGVLLLCLGILGDGAAFVYLDHASSSAEIGLNEVSARAVGAASTLEAREAMRAALQRFQGATDTLRTHMESSIRVLDCLRRLGEGLPESLVFSTVIFAPVEEEGKPRFHVLEISGSCRSSLVRSLEPIRRLEAALARIPGATRVFRDELAAGGARRTSEEGGESTPFKVMVAFEGTKR
jgi:hypothetical protein